MYFPALCPYTSLVQVVTGKNQIAAVFFLKFQSHGRFKPEVKTIAPAWWTVNSGPSLQLQAPTYKGTI
jgi:hypothetical protein